MATNSALTAKNFGFDIFNVQKINGSLTSTDLKKIKIPLLLSKKIIAIQDTNNSIVSSLGRPQLGKFV